ncbi:MAG TPA: class I SAM-dependent methyltransferase [Solirubrobacteraceae bacterium]|nr:class I SAM-dependent methyltransferase [Solirubrobacteraceae bacterium]
MTERFVPAAGRAWLTGLYDPVVALTMRERTFRSRLVRQVLADLRDGGTVVDVGSGTGTLAIALAAARPDARVVGVEPDDAVRERARRKRGSERIEWLAGTADALPVAGAGADRVVCSLVLHHLPPPVRRAALREVHRVLRPGGRFHVADWGRPSDVITRAGAWAIQRLDGVETTADLVEGRLPELLAEAGLERAAVHDRLRTAWGALELSSAARP